MAAMGFPTIAGTEFICSVNVARPTAAPLACVVISSRSLRDRSILTTWIDQGTLGIRSFLYESPRPASAGLVAMSLSHRAREGTKNKTNARNSEEPRILICVLLARVSLQDAHLHHGNGRRILTVKLNGRCNHSRITFSSLRFD